MDNPKYNIGDKIYSPNVDGEITSIWISKFQDGFSYGINKSEDSFYDVLEENVQSVEKGCDEKINFNPKYNLGDWIKGKGLDGKCKSGVIEVIAFIRMENEFVYFFDDENSGYGTNLYENNIFENQE